MLHELLLFLPLASFLTNVKRLALKTQKYKRLGTCWMVHEEEGEGRALTMPPNETTKNMAITIKAQQ